MPLTLRRVIAYIIDIILVSMVSSIISTNVYINKDYNKYMDTFDKYSKEYDNYVDEVDTLKKDFDDEKITEDVYNSKLEKLDKDFSTKDTDYNYKLIKLSIIPTILNILIILFYFVVIQFYFGGKTLGKKIMKIKVVSNNGKDLTIINFLIRSLILNGVLISISNIIFLLLLSKNNYIVYNNIIYVVNYVVEALIVFTILFDKNKRGVHDYLSNTIVKEDINEV